MRKTPRSRKPNPVLAALAKADLLSALRDIQLRAYMAVDGEPDRELLARLFFIIAIGAETSLAAGRDLALTKRLHATLRTILAMSEDGGRWRAEHAEHMHRAADEAHAVSVEHFPLAMSLYPRAVSLSAGVQAGTARMDDVAGAEIYSERA